MAQEGAEPAREVVQEICGFLVDARKVRGSHAAASRRLLPILMLMLPPSCFVRCGVGLRRQEVRQMATESVVAVAATQAGRRMLRECQAIRPLCV